MAAPSNPIPFEAVPLELSLAQALDRHLDCPPNLAEAIRYSLLAPGKRIRPRLTLACARMIGLDPAAALPAALAVEMVHCFTLIHDDLPCMDDDDFRRGRPSNHKVHGEALALLAGDALMMVALDVLAETAPLVRASEFVHALKRFAWASGPRGVIGGQAAESLLGADSRLTDLEQMHAMKTGALFSAALLIPKDLAGIADSDPRGQVIERFAAELGIAFQVADDLDDAIQDASGGVDERALPTSVLFYISPQSARDDTLLRLRAATEALQESWGPQETRELSAVADEVCRSLERTVQA